MGFKTPGESISTQKVAGERKSGPFCVVIFFNIRKPRRKGLSKLKTEKVSKWSVQGKPQPLEKNRTRRFDLRRGERTAPGEKFPTRAVGIGCFSFERRDFAASTMGSSQIKGKLCFLRALKDIDDETSPLRKREADVGYEGDFWR